MLKRPWRGLYLGAFGFYSLIYPAFAASSPEAEAEYKALKEFAGLGPPVGTARMSQEESEWFYKKGIELNERGLKFWSNHPMDPLRWDVWGLLSPVPQFTREVNENGQITKVRDVERIDAWRARYEQGLLDLLEAPDASALARQRAYSNLTAIKWGRWGSRAKTPEGQAALAQMLGWFDRNQRENPAGLGLVTDARKIAEMLDASDPLQCQRFLLGLINKYPTGSRRDRDMRAMAEGRLKVLLGQANQVWMRLAALDGRFVETKEYQGKLVLLAIVPLMWEQQIAYMKDLHAKYHERGFEIIHITGGESSRAGEESRDALQTALEVDEKNLPWRVVWDRKGTIGEVSRSLGKNVYPGWLLLSRDGRFVAETSSPSALNRAIEAELAIKPE